ncbi:hypothetical protein AAHE18_13G350500 [Arachis hypogaea]
MSKAEKKERAEFTIREMGLQDAINTRIGGWGCKGISGGQKRRVSICIEILTRPRLLFLDEPTSGLDSAASYYVMKRIKSLDHKDGIQRTIIASIHQPSAEVFQFFDNLCLLSAGKTVYFGPASDAIQFFASNGFPCPSLQNPSDHLLKTINKDFDQDRGSLLAFVSTFITFMSIGGFPSFVEDMKVFERERLNGHYGVSAFVIGNTLSAIPFVLLVSFIPGAIAYYLPGLQSGCDHFLYFICVLFSCLMLVESLMMIVASVVPNYLMGIITGSGIQGIMILVAGFFKLPSTIPKPFWRYPLHYIAFHTYAFQGLFKNEYEGLKFHGGSSHKYITGEEIMRDTWQTDMSYSKWVDLAILVGMIGVYRVMFLVIIKITEKVKPIVGSFKLRSPKQTIYVVENPNATPLHVELGNNKRNEEKEEKEGMCMCMTWKDVWVTASMGNKGSKPILAGLTGYAKPGQLLAIMGPSGSGKSTLLDALAGRLDSNTRQTGEILINGRKEALAYGISAYVTQDDTLLTTLTVREAVHYSAQLQLPDSMSKAEKRERAEITIREMGLQDAINTRIGGWGIKGISGGQKRRVSICIEILTRPRLLFLDEPTSGLDSAASYYVMKRIANLVQKDGIQRTVIASIHQPSTEVFQLFHNLCLMSSGTTVYFGPASTATQFFASNGFPCPALQNPSDHLLKTINKDFDQDTDMGLSGTRTVPTEEAIRILISAYESSEIKQQVQQEVAMLSNQETRSVDHKKRRRAGFLNQCIVLTKISCVNMFRDLGYYWLRLGIYIALAIATATVFYDLGTSFSTIQDRGALLMFESSFITFMTIGGFPSFVEVMKVFERERLNGHYGVVAFVIGNTVSSVPYLVLVSVIPGAMAYYLPHLQRGFDHFVYFICVLFSCLMLVESLMMIVASIVPNYLMGIISGAGIQGIMMLAGGFFRLPNDLPKPFWRYPMFYVAFHRFAFQGLYKNEFQGLSFATNDGNGSYISGDEILRDTWQVDMSYSKWVDLGILLGMILVYRVLFFLIIKITEKLKPFFVSFISGSPKRATLVMENNDNSALSHQA